MRRNSEWTIRSYFNWDSVSETIICLNVQIKLVSWCLELFVNDFVCKRRLVRWLRQKAIPRWIYAWIFHVQRLAVCRNYKLFSFLFRSISSIPQSDSFLSKSFRDVRHLSSSKLSHAILNWILGIFEWSRMRRIDREVTRIVMISRRDRISVVVVSRPWINVWSKLVYLPSSQSIVIQSLILAYCCIIIEIFSLRVEVEHAWWDCIRRWYNVRPQFFSNTFV